MYINFLFDKTRATDIRKTAKLEDAITKSRKLKGNGLATCTEEG